jgi:hypothetical protein
MNYNLIFEIEKLMILEHIDYYFVITDKNVLLCTVRRMTLK